MQQAPGTVESQSVAVLVNSKAIPKGLSLASLQKGVAAAAGIDTARGDQLAFSAMPFNTVGGPAGGQGGRRRLGGQPEAGHGRPDQGGGRLPDHRRGAVPRCGARPGRPATRPPTQVLGPADLAALTRSLSDEPTGQLPAAMAEISNTREAGDVNRFIDSQPDDVATMLRGWLTDAPSLSNS